MSRFLKPRLARLKAYTPGEQPRDKKYIKLNTNESPYPPSPEVVAAVRRAQVEDLRLYSDPEGKALKEKLAGLYGLSPENVFIANGSDDILSFAFMAFAGEGVGARFPDITYSFYKVFADLHGVSYKTIPLVEDFSVRPEDYFDSGDFTVIANPNAPTGIALTREQLRTVIASNPDRVVLIDEAYADFGAESAVPLIAEYPNLLVVMTYSKSRALAGARLGVALASPELIADLELLKYSTNPYNVNRLTMDIGCAAVESDAYFRENCRKIMETREETARTLEEWGFRVLHSQANFLFITREGMDGGAFYQALKERGVLVRHFARPRIEGFVRVTVGAPEEMKIFLTAVREICQGEGM
jgi:histidinol-phosphate aminotransferase